MRWTPPARYGRQVFIKKGSQRWELFCYLPGYPPRQIGYGRRIVSQKMPAQVFPAAGTDKPLNQRQLRAIDLRCEGHSWDQITKQLDITLRTIQNWRKHPEWETVLEHRKKEWVKEYELRFTKMLPDVAKRHQQLVHSQSEAIAMRAVDSAHANHVRCIQQQETKSEVQELKEMVQMLCDQLAQQRAQ